MSKELVENCNLNNSEEGRYKKTYLHVEGQAIIKESKPRQWEPDNQDSVRLNRLTEKYTFGDKVCHKI